MALALAGHAGLAMLFSWALGRKPIVVEPPTIRVILVRPETARSRRAPHATPAAARTALETTAEDVSERLAPLPAGPSAATPGPDTDDAGVRRVLRARLGCGRTALFGLTEVERARCEAQLAETKPRDPAKFDLDPRGAYAASDEPVLSRRPKNGCRVRAAGDRGVMGEHGAAAGVSCAWSF